MTAVVGGVAALGGAGFEAACYFTDDRITDYPEVLAIMQHLDENHDSERFQLVRGVPGRNDDAIRIWNAKTEVLDSYLITDLYLVNGRLWASRSWKRDHDLGMLLFIQPAD